MRKILFMATAFAMSPILAQAATLVFPSDAPIASVTIPDEWEPKETVSGIEAKSPDSAIYFSIDVATDKDTDKVIQDAVKFLTDNGVTIDDSTQTDSGDVEINGMTFGSIEYEGKDADGPVDVSLGFASPAEGKMLVVTYWGTKATQGAHSKALEEILKSLKPSN
ncbi:histidine kinase (plasmid) [Rhizobium sp. 32-5/1]|uniref:histidine kinase n=1 Tax=Rhizobium sp. 32-5/1 TaxID=3019602 RepID=UPI00240CFABE|nr:histidine kinase [Rhizobium sp. 32-5/1]WEZ85945.1 histidine kinase [Rhizobium sp. 32-5/1]